MVINCCSISRFVPFQLNVTNNSKMYILTRMSQQNLCHKSLGYAHDDINERCACLVESKSAFYEDILSTVGSCDSGHPGIQETRS